jgi:putative hemolysin
MDNCARLWAFLTLLLILASIPLIATPGAALMNPAAVYCTALNYSYISVTGPDGMTGYCVLSGNQKVEAWKFLQGKEATQYSYCAKQGYVLEITNDRKTCQVFMTDTCAVCVLPDGTKTEVTKLMGLDFREKLCSNGKCCDPAKDTSCTFGSPPPFNPVYVVLLALIILIVIAAIFLWKKRKTAGKS